MFLLPAQKEDVLRDFPIVSEWLDTIQFNILKKQIEDNKLELYYTYGYFLPKAKNKEEFYIDLQEKCNNMLFDERLVFELSKIRVSLTLKVGKFAMSNRLPKGVVPEQIREIVTEVTKVKMMLEGEYHENQEVINSIPDVDTSIVSFDIIKDAMRSEDKDRYLNVDEILDKISKDGIDSLSDEERDFLDRKSKES
jgi:hypothetical protein